jgi:L-alanine-DL-glutamate epimerase-like enolase superfamily enzyme
MPATGKLRQRGAVGACAPPAAGGSRRAATPAARGAARNALDCALWDLEAKLSGISVAERLGLPAPTLPTALTVTIDNPEAMARRRAIWAMWG